jgi:hypothetical protein
MRLNLVLEFLSVAMFSNPFYHMSPIFAFPAFFLAFFLAFSPAFFLAFFSAGAATGTNDSVDSSTVLLFL